MPVSDILIVFQWWSALFLLGAVAYPLTKQLFGSWFDRGYLFSKSVGLAVVSYLVYVFASIRILPFTPGTIYLAMAACFIGGLVPQLLKKQRVVLGQKQSAQELMRSLSTWWNDLFWDKGIIFVIEECFFFALLLFWSWVKAHEPSIRGLEKFMDYGFMQSVLNTRYFPSPDMWWAGGSINYYYFGHLVTAVVTKLSNLSLGYTFNIMLATLFALTASMSFSIGYQLLHMKKKVGVVTKIIGGVVTSFLVTMAGNMQTLYAFTKGYSGEDVLPFWQLLWPMGEFVNKVGVGIETYWYANATRFIPFSIHEFPSYSFVVSDVHGHVLSLPFVLLALALLLVFFGRDHDHYETTLSSVEWARLVFYGFLLGILLMTNALDGPIYGGIFAFIWLFVIVLPQRQKFKTHWWDFVYPVSLVALLAFVTALPFLFFFSSFASGIGVNCPPSFLANSTIGPLLFEEVEKCQHSPLWMMWLLWGFFWFSGIWLFVQKIWKKENQNATITRVLKLFFLFSIGLIIFPEFLYVKDIYPAHFRSNTMFKLGYQAFIMWSIVAGYIMMHFFVSQEVKKQKFLRLVFFVLLAPQLFLVSIYPLFSIRSYFNSLTEYKQLWGMGWMEEEYPDYWNAVSWLQTQYKVNAYDIPIIVEAAGDSYTDYNQVSAFTGFPSVTGWAVHEWLWRGSYDIVSPRQEDVRIIYESTDPTEVGSILAFYHVHYIIVGSQEREKYPNLQESTLDAVGARVFSSGDVIIWDVLKR